MKLCYEVMLRFDLQWKWNLFIVIFLILNHFYDVILSNSAQEVVNQFHQFVMGHLDVFIFDHWEFQRALFPTVNED